MKTIESIQGKIIPLNRADVDTDQIMPKQFLKRIERSGYGPFAFYEWRKEESFVLNDSNYIGAPIMLAQQNFGCGSSREHAVWGLEDIGVQAILAPSFADIFRNNCSKVGLLTIVLDQSDIDYLMSRAEELPDSQVRIDLSSQTVKLEGSDWQRSFEIDPFVKHRLLNGLDDIGITMQYEDEISSYESSRSSKKPDTSSAFEDTMKVG